MELAYFLIGLAVVIAFFDAAAIRWGHDSRR